MFSLLGETRELLSQEVSVMTNSAGTLEDKCKMMCAFHVYI